MKTIKRSYCSMRRRLLHHSYFKENYKLIAVDLSKQEVFDIDPKAI